MSAYLPLSEWESLRPANEFLSRASRIALLSHEEEIELAQSIEQGAIAGHSLAIRKAAGDAIHVAKAASHDFAVSRTARRLGMAAVKPWSVEATRVKSDYLKAILENVPVQAASESDLQHAIVKGNDAHTQLVLSNIRLCTRYAKRFSSRFYPAEDLLQESYFYLRRAASEFHPERIGRDGKRVRFARFAGQVVHDGLGRTVASSFMDPIYVSVPLSTEEENDGNRPKTEYFVTDSFEWASLDAVQQQELLNHLKATYSKDEITFIARRFGLLGFFPQELGQMAREMGVPLSWMQNRISPAIKAKIKADTRLRTLCERATHIE